MTVETPGFTGGSSVDAYEVEWFEPSPSDVTEVVVVRAPTTGFVAVGGVRNDGAETGAAGPTLEGSFRLALSPATTPHPSGYPTDVTSVETTKPIGIRASAAEVKAALEALPSVRGVTVTLAAAGAGPGAAPVADGDACCTWLVTFDGHSAGLDAAVSVSAVALRVGLVARGACLRRCCVD